jgi:hypothetical protein
MSLLWLFSCSLSENLNQTDHLAEYQADWLHISMQAWSKKPVRRLVYPNPILVVPYTPKPDVLDFVMITESNMSSGLPQSFYTNKTYGHFFSCLLSYTLVHGLQVPPVMGKPHPFCLQKSIPHANI